MDPSDSLRDSIWTKVQLVFGRILFVNPDLKVGAIVELGLF